MEALPHLAWAIGISDSIATVDLMVNGTKVKFTGVGYHDSIAPPFASHMKIDMY